MKLAGVGDNVVDRYRDLGTMYPGGQALNVAVYAHRAGIPTAYVGVLGDDAAGAHVLGAIRSEGVDASHLRVVPGPNAYAEVSHTGGNRVFVGHDAGVSKFRLTPADLDFLSGFRPHPQQRVQLPRVPARALAATAPVSFDFSVRDQAYVDPLLPYVSIAEFSLPDFDDTPR